MSFISWLARAIVNSVFASHLVPRRIRYLALKLWLADLNSWKIGPSCFFGGRQVSIGHSSFVNVGCLFDGLAPIMIGDHCYLGMRVSLLTSDHEIGSSTRRAADLRSGPIRIGNGCWLGANVSVLPNVQIATGCIIAAGSVVTSDCAPNGLYAGVPATRVRDLP